jgi:hypothetical protein
LFPMAAFPAYFPPVTPAAIPQAAVPRVLTPCFTPRSRRGCAAVTRMIRVTRDAHVTRVRARRGGGVGWAATADGRTREAPAGRAGPPRRVARRARQPVWGGRRAERGGQRAGHRLGVLAQTVPRGRGRPGRTRHGHAGRPGRTRHGSRRGHASRPGRTRHEPQHEHRGGRAEPGTGHSTGTAAGRGGHGAGMAAGPRKGPGGCAGRGCHGRVTAGQSDR